MRKCPLRRAVDLEAAMGSGPSPCKAMRHMALWRGGFLHRTVDKQRTKSRSLASAVRTIFVLPIEGPIHRGTIYLATKLGLGTEVKKGEFDNGASEGGIAPSARPRSDHHGE